MKQLLYIPNGNYITFWVDVNLFSSLEAYEKRWNVSSDKVIQQIISSGEFSQEFFERNGLPEADKLAENHFEVVNN